MEQERESLIELTQSLNKSYTTSVLENLYVKRALRARFERKRVGDFRSLADKFSSA